MAPTDDLREVTELIDAGRDLEAARRGAARTRDQEEAPMDPLTQLELLGPALGGVVAGIRAQDLSSPTPCDELDVRGILEHMIGGATAFAAAFRGVEASEPDVSDPLAGFGPALGDLVAAINGPGALERTVAAPFGEVPGDTFARFVVLDGLVHGWDLAVATGQPYAPPDDLVAAVSTFAHGALDALRDGSTFGNATDVPADAPPMQQLAAYTGRRT